MPNVIRYFERSFPGTYIEVIREYDNAHNPVSVRYGRKFRLARDNEVGETAIVPDMHTPIRLTPIA
jgi:hypothetical protein